MRSLLILVLALSETLSAQHRPITLDAYEQWRTRAVSGPGEPAWSPSGASFAYRDGDGLVLYDVASHAKRILAHFGDMNASVVAPSDDGDPWQNRNVFTRQITWSPRGDQILYVSSGDLILIDAKTGKWRNLTKSPTAEADPKLSPDGTRIAFRRAWDLYTLDIASGKETRLTTNGSDTLRNAAVDWVYPEELDLATAYWWSPDSRSILYLQFNTSGEPQYPHASLLSSKAFAEPQRYPQAGDPNASVRPGIVPVTGGPTKWLDIGDTVNSYLVARAGWTPDSHHVWIARLNRIQNQLAMIMFDAGSGALSSTYQEVEPHWINVEGDPIFLPDSSAYIWTHEGDGYRHLYSHTLSVAKPREITDGFWQITSISCVDAKEKQVYYVSTEAGVLERQLYRIGFDGMGKTRLTTAPGTHRISMAPGCGAYLDTHSNLTSPPEIVLRSTSSAVETVFRPANHAVLDEFDLRTPETISFDAPELPANETTAKAQKTKVKLYGHLLKPPNFDPTRKYPLIVDVYGGPHDQSVRDAWPGLSFDQVLAAHGYLVWQMDNRGTYGRGHAFETPVFHNLGKVELADQRAGIEYLISQGFVDRSRIGVHGWSYGGFMALNMLLNAPDLIHAALAGAPVTDWRNYDTIYTERYMGLPTDNESGYRESSLIARAAALNGRLMLAHNFEDDNVLFQNTAQLTNALQAAGKQFEMQVYGGKGHGVTGASARQMDAAMLDFFDRGLGP